MSTTKSPNPSYKKFEIRHRNPDPKASVLLVIDMQKYFSSIAKPILPTIKTTIDLCRRASIPVIFTRHSHKSPDDAGNMLCEWWDGDLIIDGTPEAELMAEVGRREGEDAVVEKDTYSAFRGTGLEERLAGMGGGGGVEDPPQFSGRPEEVGRELEWELGSRVELDLS